MPHWRGIFCKTHMALALRCGTWPTRSTAWTRTRLQILSTAFIATGLDIDALRDVANAVNGLKTDKTVTLMVTHYKRLLNYIKPDVIHVMEVCAPFFAVTHRHCVSAHGSIWCHSLEHSLPSCGRLLHSRLLPRYARGRRA